MLKAKDFRNAAWGKLDGKRGTLAVIALIYFAISGAAAALSRIGIGVVALILITGPLVVGMVFVGLRVVRGEGAEIKDLFHGFVIFDKSFLLHLLNSIFIALWAMLFIIPGIIKSFSYAMSYYIICDNPEMGANEARKKSMEMMDGNKWRLFCLRISFIGWCLLSVLTLGILFLWVMPYMQAAEAEFYESIKGGAAE